MGRLAAGGLMMMGALFIAVMKAETTRHPVLVFFLI